MLLAAAGLYGVLSTIASQYRKEIGVRMALGAAWLDILQLVVKRGLIVSAAGVGVGLLGVLGGARLLRGFLFRISPTDPIAIGTASLLMLTIAAIACYIRRGARPVRIRWRPCEWTDGLNPVGDALLAFTPPAETVSSPPRRV
jgi:ABC-type antimicrobial peptide transport system permease subunit